MHFSVLTLFPNLFNDFLKESIIARAIKNHLVSIEIINFRDYATNRLKQVDDYQIGGGGGMVIALPSIVACLKKIRTRKSHVILLSPQGKTFNQQMAQTLVNSKKYDHIILICGRYEGFDERILYYVDEVISIGDYVLNGGEVPSMVLLEACIRLIPQVINDESLKNESFTNYLLDYPCYTKPDVFENHPIPTILKSGNHQAIDQYRLKKQIEKTKKLRPDLYKKYIKYK